MRSTEIKQHVEDILRLEQAGDFAAAEEKCNQAKFSRNELNELEVGCFSESKDVDRKVIFFLVCAASNLNNMHSPIHAFKEAATLLSVSDPLRSGLLYFKINELHIKKKYNESRSDTRDLMYRYLKFSADSFLKILKDNLYIVELYHLKKMVDVFTFMCFHLFGKLGPTVSHADKKMMMEKLSSCRDAVFKIAAENPGFDSHRISFGLRYRSTLDSAKLHGKITNAEMQSLELPEQSVLHFQK